MTLSVGKKSSNRIISVQAKNSGQTEALKSINENKITFIYGCPGTGKSHVAVGWGLQELLGKRIERMILTRPALESGEKLGYLPGGFDSKIAPFMMPMFELMSAYLDNDDINNLIVKKKIIILPIGYMRGVTLNDAYVVIDEMQNTTIKQVHLILTRLGQNSKIVATGDIYQSDLIHQNNGLTDAIVRLKDVKGINFVEMTEEHCVRDPLVSTIDKKYRAEYTQQMYQTLRELIPNAPDVDQSRKLDKTKK